MGRISRVELQKREKAMEFKEQTIDFSEKNKKQAYMARCFNFVKDRIGRENAVTIQSIVTFVFGGLGDTKPESDYRKLYTRKLIQNCRRYYGVPIHAIRVKVPTDIGTLKSMWYYWIPKDEKDAHWVRDKYVRNIKGNIKWMVWTDVSTPMNEEKKKEILTKAKMVDMAADELLVYSEKAKPIILEPHAVKLVKKKKKKKKKLVEVYA